MGNAESPWYTLLEPSRTIDSFTTDYADPCTPFSLAFASAISVPFRMYWLGLAMGSVCGKKVCNVLKIKRAIVKFVESGAMLRMEVGFIAGVYAGP